MSLTNAYSAEFGRSAGGVFNAVTRSGANTFTGSLFEFHRNSALDARNFFDPPSAPKPDFTRHQFGAVLGGPVRRDRTFFFAAYEGLKERLGVTGVSAVPDDDARRGILAGRPLTLHPAVPRYLDTLFPRANGRSLGNGGAEYLFSGTQPTDEHFYQLRVDHRLSAADSAFVRATHDRADVARIPANKPPISTIDEQTRNTYITGEHLHTFSSSMLNQLRVGLNRSVSLADNRRTIEIPPDLAWLPGEQFGYLTIQGLVTEMAGDFRLPRNDRLNNWQISDMLIRTRGKHSLGSALHRRAWLQPLGQSEHDRLLAPRTSGPEAGMLVKPGAWRAQSLLGCELLPVAGGQHARQSRTEHVDRTGLRVDRCVAREVVRPWRQPRAAGTNRSVQHGDDVAADSGGGEGDVLGPIWRILGGLG